MVRCVHPVCRLHGAIAAPVLDCSVPCYFVVCCTAVVMPYSVLHDPLLLDALTWHEIEEIYFLLSESEPESYCFTAQYGLLDVAVIKRRKFLLSSSASKETTFLRY